MGDKPRRRFQFTLRKLFLIVAAYAVALSALSRFGWVGIVLAGVIGTEVSALLIFLRKEELRSAVNVAVGSLVGVVFVVFFFVISPLGSVAVSDIDIIEDLAADMALAGMGALIGGYLFSAFVKK